MTDLKNREGSNSSVILLKIVVLDLGICGVVGRKLELLGVGRRSDRVRILARAPEFHCFIRLDVLPGAVAEVLRVGTVSIGDAHTNHLVEGVARQLHNKNIEHQNQRD